MHTPVHVRKLAVGLYASSYLAANTDTPGHPQHTQVTQSEIPAIIEGTLRRGTPAINESTSQGGIPAIIESIPQRENRRNP